ncbi:MAG: hypothetical protein R3B09_17840 [Nannocystaceae bacterium]
MKPLTPLRSRLLTALRGLPRDAGSLRSFLARHAYLGLAAAALLVVTRTVDFAPPAQVRTVELPPAAPAAPPAAPGAELQERMSAAEAVQLRARLRLLEGPPEVLRSAQDDPSAGRTLSEPIVATVLGVPAAIDHSVRLDGGALEVRIAIEATPRAEERRPIVVDHTLEISSRRGDRWGERGPRRIHLRTQAALAELDARPERLFFTVDEHLFALDLELHRPAGG